MGIQQKACKEAIEKLLLRVSKLEDTVALLTSYLHLELGTAAATEIIKRIESAKDGE